MKGVGVQYHTSALSTFLTKHFLNSHMTGNLLQNQGLTHIREGPKLLSNKAPKKKIALYPAAFCGAFFRCRGIKSTLPPRLRNKSILVKAKGSLVQFFTHRGRIWHLFDIDETPFGN
ncbi:hypothetical protein PMIN07_011635 [Paraphaeosphaeria minitans]